MMEMCCGITNNNPNWVTDYWDKEYREDKMIKTLGGKKKSENQSREHQ